MTTKLVYEFDDHWESGRELLGGKGLGLAKMIALGLPVPEGFLGHDRGRLATAQAVLSADARYVRAGG